MGWLLNLIGPLIILINNIWSAFKKSPTEEIEDEFSKRKKEIDKQKDKARKAP